MEQEEFNGFDLQSVLINDQPEINPLIQEITTKFGIDLKMRRKTAMYFYQYFIPVIAIAITSFFSFIVPLTMLPGRVVIVVTQFLTLTNIFIHEMVCKDAQILMIKCKMILRQKSLWYSNFPDIPFKFSNFEFSLI